MFSGELEVPILTVSATEMVSGVSGDSESKIRDLFEQAKASAPCILFIDNIDVIAKKRENAQKDMELRIVGQLLTSMDDLNKVGLEPEGQVFVIGATSRLETLDPALRIGERLERDVAMGIPDEKARVHILTVMCRNLSFSQDTELFKSLSRLTPGYVGSDLKSLIKCAANFAVDRHFNTMKSKYQSDSHILDQNVPRYGDNEFFSWLSDNSEANEQLTQLSVTFQVRYIC